MNRKHIPELGKQYGNFTVISEEIGRSNDQKILFKVRCSCGKEQFVRAYFLESGRQSCCKECRSRINYNLSKTRNTKIAKIKRCIKYLCKLLRISMDIYTFAKDKIHVLNRPI